MEYIAEPLRKLAVPIDSVFPDPANARRHPDKNMDAICGSLRSFGQVKPIVVRKDKMIVVCGNGTLAAAKSLGWKHIAAVVKEMDDMTATRLAIADNRSAELAEWDKDELEDLLANIEEDDESLKAMFEGLEEELAEMQSEILPTPGDGGDDFDATPQDAGPTRTQLGDLWVIGGKHRLIVGDNSDVTLVEKMMDGRMATLLFTDPPYGVAVGDKNKFLNTFQPSGRCLETIKDDVLSPDDLKQQLIDSFNTIYPFLADDCATFVCSPQGGSLGIMMMMMMQEVCLEARHVIIWKKNSPTFSLGRLDYDYQHEPILFSWKKTHKRKKEGQHQTSVWEVDKPRSSKDHPTMKPVELPTNAILNHTDNGDVVVDIYLGSGTTMIAAHRTNRVCYGAEISPRFADVVLKRCEAEGLECVRSS